MGSHIPPFIVA